jgi:hypothetical protein
MDVFGFPATMQQYPELSKVPEPIELPRRPREKPEAWLPGVWNSPSPEATTERGLFGGHRGMFDAPVFKEDELDGRAGYTIQEHGPMPKTAFQDESYRHQTNAAIAALEKFMTKAKVRHIIGDACGVVGCNFGDIMQVIAEKSTCPRKTIVSIIKVFKLIKYAMLSDSGANYKLAFRVCRELIDDLEKCL